MGSFQQSLSTARYIFANSETAYCIHKDKFDVKSSGNADHTIKWLFCSPLAFSTLLSS